MAYLVSQAIANAQRTLPDLQNSRALDLINQVQREILSEIPELQRNLLTTITPVSGTGEYSIGETAFQVDLCTYVSAGGAASVISGTTVESLDQQSVTWRKDAAAGAYPVAGKVVQFYTSSALISAANTPVIGFYPVPGFTTGSIFVWGSQLQAADLSTSDTCLITLFSSQIYVAGLVYYGACELRPEIAAAWKASYAEEIAKEIRFVRSRNGMVRGYQKPDYNNRPGGEPPTH